MEARGKHLINLGSLLTPVRHDRDDFIRVNEENIAPDKKTDFAKRPYGDAGFHTAGSVDPNHTPYDVLSVIGCEKRVPCFGSFFKEFKYFPIVFWNLP